jgi:hypothetical protein
LDSGRLGWNLLCHCLAFEGVRRWQQVHGQNYRKDME